MTSQNEEGHNEIIIVRRGGNDGEGEHHGGVWKIAYADFMTAMMAFFLVMWLINAADEETKAAVSNYFNPIKLIDRHSNPRGLQENEAVQSEGNQSKVGNVTKEEGDSDEANQAQSQNSSSISTNEQIQIMRQPYETLDEIADSRIGTATRFEGLGGATQGGSQTGANAGLAYRDPFSPEYWAANVSPEVLGLSRQAELNSADISEHEAQIQAMLENVTGQVQQGQGQQGQGQQGQAQQGLQQNNLPQPSADSEVKGKSLNTTALTNDAQNGNLGATQGTISSMINGDSEEDEGKGANALSSKVEKISSELASLLGSEADTEEPLVQVTAVNDGIRISLMDNVNFGMFGVGSSTPDKQTVDLLAEIAKILTTLNGEIIISGHTDARPYKTATYDNWQLSTARAQMAYYMLVRGGLDEKRVLRVEGYADRELKNKDDPFAAENRRIEIFVRPENVNSAQQEAQSSAPTVQPSTPAQNTLPVRAPNNSGSQSSRQPETTPKNI